MVKSQLTLLVSALRDLEGDGVPDALIGSHAYSNVGAAYLQYGTSAGSGSLRDANFIIAGDDIGDNLGYSLAIGDLDGDDRGDIVVGALGDDGTGVNAGSVDVFLVR